MVTADGEIDATMRDLCMYDCQHDENDDESRSEAGDMLFLFNNYAVLNFHQTETSSHGSRAAKLAC